MHTLYVVSFFEQRTEFGRFLEVSIGKLKESLAFLATTEQSIQNALNQQTSKLGRF